MHGVSRLLFAWLLLAGIVSLLAGAARADRQASHHEATDKHGARIPLFYGDGPNGLPDELAVESKPDQGIHPHNFGSLITAPIDQERTTRFFVSEQTWRESALRDARPIRGPPAGLLG